LVLQEEGLTKEALLEAIRSVYENRKHYMETMENAQTVPSIDCILALIEETAAGKKDKASKPASTPPAPQP
jgi:hypothetical protein